jgi:TonB family protein
VWAESAPAPEDYVEAYPTQALREGIEEGHVRLACTIRTDRTLDCSVQSESPEGVGFGPAALRVVEKFVVRPVEQDPRLMVGAHVVVPILFYLHEVQED